MMNKDRFLRPPTCGIVHADKHALAVPALLAGSDMLALLPFPLASLFARGQAPAHAWLRERIEILGRALAI